MLFGPLRFPILTFNHLHRLSGVGSSTLPYIPEAAYQYRNLLFFDASILQTYRLLLQAPQIITCR